MRSRAWDVELTMVRKTSLLTAFFLGFLGFTGSSVTDQGGACQQVADYPYFNEQCVNVSGSATPCKDIRECDFADAILALGGWPTVCGWVEDGTDDEDEPMEWPKVCCGMPLTLGEPLKKNFVKQMGRKKGSTLSTKGEIRDTDYRGGNTAQCVLPLVPQPDTSVTPEDGVRFGNSPYSRQEFFKNSDFMFNIMNKSKFAMEFKTSGDSGIMFYIAADKSRRDYIGLFMQEGKISYVFNCGTGSALISSQNTYNDGKWHRAVFLRYGQEGELILDEQEKVSGTSIGQANRIDHLTAPLYVGGLSEEVATRGRITLQGITSSFPGCIRNVEAQDELLTPEMVSSSVKTSECSSKVEVGTYFTVDGGYLVLYEKYRVGQHVSISLDIKPRNLSGVVMAIHGKQDYLILQLVEGRVELTVDSGAGPLTATYTPGDKHDLCDGEFHTIEVESMSNNSITLTVDSVSAVERLDLESVSSIDTFDPLYIGGLPKASSSKGGVLTTDPFIGCIRDVMIDQEAASMEKSRLVGQVILNSCPTT